MSSPTQPQINYQRTAQRLAAQVGEQTLEIAAAYSVIEDQAARITELEAQLAQLAPESPAAPTEDRDEPA